MEKEAIKRTLIDILKIIVGIIGAGLFICLGEWLLFILPYWVLKGLGLWEKYANCNAGIIYFIEVLVIIGVILIVWFIRQLYRRNLEDIENEN